MQLQVLLCGNNRRSRFLRTAFWKNDNCLDKDAGSRQIQLPKSLVIQSQVVSVVKCKFPPRPTRPLHLQPTLSQDRDLNHPMAQLWALASRFCLASQFWPLFVVGVPFGRNMYDLVWPWYGRPWLHTEGLMTTGTWWTRWILVWPLGKWG